METVENTARMNKCLSFDGFSATICPLDKFMEDRIYLKGDSKCIAEKPTRFKIGKDLPNLGLLPAELKGYREYHGSVNKTREALLIKFAPTLTKKNE